MQRRRHATTKSHIVHFEETNDKQAIDSYAFKISLCLSARSRDGCTVINKCLDEYLALDVLSVEVVSTLGRIDIKMAVPM